MPADVRLVEMSGEQARILDDVVVRMVREDNEQAATIMALLLAYKFAAARPRPDNVIELTLVGGGRDDA